MTRVNRPDTLLSELHELQRRLRLLEASSVRRPPGQPPSAFARLVRQANPPPAVPFLPAQPRDWPGTSSTEWERLAVTWVARASEDAHVILEAEAEGPGTRGAVRIAVDGTPVSGDLPVTPTRERHTITVAPEPSEGEAEIAVEARRTEGDGLIRVAAALIGPS